MFQDEIFVVKVLSINAFRSGSIAIGTEISTLYHEILDNTVKNRAFVTKTKLVRCQCLEVLDSLRNCFAEQCNDYPSLRLAANAYVEVCSVGH